MNIVISLYGNDKDPFAGLYEKEEFDVLTEHGCDWCGETLDFNTPGLLVLQKTQQVLCPSCCTNPGDNTNRVFAEDIKKFM